MSNNSSKSHAFTRFCCNSVDDTSLYWNTVGVSDHNQFDISPKLRLSTFPGLGRGLVVKSPQPVNTILASIKPLVVVSNNELEELIFPEVDRNSMELQIYSRFEWFEDLDNNLFSILVIRLFVACELNKKHKRSVLALNHHKCHIYNNSLNQLIVSSVSRRITAAILANSRETASEDLAKRLLVYINTLTCICIINFAYKLDSEQHQHGYFIDPAFSLINHSCCPNIKIYFDNDKDTFSLITTSPVKSQLFTNYCTVMVPKPLRQFDLVNRFFFNCKCTLCTRKHDYFFSYNCDHCGSVLCSPNLNTFLFQDNVEELNFVSGKILKCNCCHKFVDSKKLYRNLILHKFATLLYIYLNHSEIDSTRGYFDIEYFVDEIHQYIAPSILHKDSYFRCLLKSTDKMYAPHFFIIIRRILTFIIQDRIIPPYCFPINMMVSSLVTRFRRELETYPQVRFKADFWELQLIIGLQSTFLVVIPSDLSDQYAVANMEFKFLAFVLWQVVTKIKETEKLPRLLSLYQLPVDEVLECLIWNSLFFGLEALKSFKDISPRSDKELVSLCSHLRSLKIEFGKDNQFERYLFPLFRFANIHHNFSFKNKKLKIWTASRTKKDLMDEPLL